MQFKIFHLKDDMEGSAGGFNGRPGIGGPDGIQVDVFLSTLEDNFI